ncbi:LacI family DNA-binding transcriptional regulator [Pelagicoccus sp. NFK12]|uniref:LacI family DNA-binding transcriptional regulator n=1 Tax=Pelagicoccus enzymogenes TaxID=2773457 RepID=A0A927IHU5_9BACT|nr:LacI family DNA-binding transcriptional regulator [Pelagicoccus enzymogenes]MBD5780058.1 LacI family DNA-binding transcriptional regulator [Pelagicoccus enzymogenes]
MADIAERAAVSRMTVSLALRNHPKISESTQVRVKEAAKELGYVPNPYLSVYGSHIRSAKQKKLQAQIAFLGYERIRETPNLSPSVMTLPEAIYFGAAQQCQRLGYGIERVLLDKNDISEKRMDQILMSRGILGVLLHRNFYEGKDWDLSWEKFSVAAIGSSNVPSAFHSVDCDRQEGMMRLLNEIHCLGYKRIGFAILEQQDKHQRHTNRSAVSDYQLQIPEKRRVPHLIEAQLTKKTFLQWVHKHRADVVIGGVAKMYDWLLEGGWNVPKQIGFVRPQLMPEQSSFSGICYDHTAIGAAGIDAIVGQINRNERGYSQQTRRILVSGEWQEGSSTRLMSKGRKRPVFHLA